VAVQLGVAHLAIVADAVQVNLSNISSPRSPTQKPEAPKKEMVLDALEMPRWQRGTRLPGLIAYSDAGSQISSVRHGERLVEIGATPSIGTIRDPLLTGQS